MARSIPEWQGRTDDAAIPLRVSLRVCDRQKNEAGLIVCAYCGQVIHPGDGVDMDHKTALADGGQHAEGNLQAVHRRCHKLKTAKEAQSRAIHRKKVAHHFGVRKAKSRGFQKPKGAKFDWKRGRYVFEEKARNE